jgi:hypothetical protein
MFRLSIALSLSVVGCVLVAAPAIGAEQPRPRPRVKAPAPQPPAEEQAPKGTLKGYLTQLGPSINNPNGDGRVLPITARVRLPEGKKVKFFAGTMEIRSLEDATRVLWSGPCEFDPEVSDDGEATLFVNVPYDDADPKIVELSRSPVGFRVMQQKGILGPPVEIRMDRIEYADGKKEKF